MSVSWSGSVPASLIGTSGREDASQMKLLSFHTQGFRTDRASNEGALFIRHLLSVFFQVVKLHMS